MRTLPVILAGILAATRADGGAPEVLWSIGQRDGHGIEFAPGARPNLTFQIGASQVSRDFAGHHEGSFGFEPGKPARENPYTIRFDLPPEHRGDAELELDMIFQAGAPRRMKIIVNGRKGIYPIRHEIMKSAFGEQANAMLLARQRLIARIAGEWLKPKGNEITLIPTGIGGLDYDCISLRRASSAPGEERARLEPTIFFRGKGRRLVEVCELLIPFEKKFARGWMEGKIGDERISAAFSSGEYDFGLWSEPIETPAFETTKQARLSVSLDGESRLVEHEITPAKRWKLFICPKVHNDVGFTDLQPHVNELDNRNTDAAMRIMNDFPFYKFNFETSWLVENYLDCRPENWRRLFFDYARRNRALINVLYLNLMTGLCTGEELHRALYFAHRLHREFGTSFDFACLTDAPSHSWFLPTLLSDVGVRAFSNGSNQTRAPILHFSDLNENSPFYWEGMNGERIFMWFARSYVQWKRLTGPDFVSGAANYEYLKTSIPQFLTQFMRADYAPDAVMVYGAYVDNAAIPRTGEAELAERWNKEFEYPKLVVASDSEYFNYIDKHFRAKLPVYRGDCGAYWEDGAASSAEATAWNRRAQQILPGAETAASLASIFDPKNRYPAEDFQDAWKNLLFYDEHTWGAHNSISQPDKEFVTRQWEIKENYARRANLGARNLLNRGLNRFCQNIAVAGDTLLAFNWQPRPREAVLEVELDEGRYLVDLVTGKPVEAESRLARDGYRRLRFIAEAVPAFGYKGYAIRSLGAEAIRPNVPVEGDTIESAFYRATIDVTTGGLKSLYDKTAQRELVDPAAAYRLNETIYVSGGEGSLILNHTFGTPPAHLVIQRPGRARIVEMFKTPIGTRLVMETTNKNLPLIRSEYVLYDKLKRLDIINTLRKEETRAKEAVYFAFPFAAQKPEFAYQIQNGWCRPNQDQMPGACREWFTPQNLVHLRDGGFDVAWSTPDAPLACLTEINRGKWLAHLPIKNGHVYSYVMHNYWFTNYRARQGGNFTFRYSVTSGSGLSLEQLARFDVDTRSPVTAYPFVSSFSAGVTGENRPLAAAAGSFLTVADENLEVVTLKAAEVGGAWILRLRETAGRNGASEARFSRLKVVEANLCNGVEEIQYKLAVKGDSVTIPYRKNAFTTVRLVLEPNFRTPAPARN